MTDTKDKKREKLGILCCTAGATSWGLSGTCSEALFSQYPVDTTWVTAVRMTSAGIILLFLAFAKHSLNLKELGKDKKGLIEIVLFAIAGLALCQYAYLSAIKWTNSGTATVIQNLSIVFIAVYVCLTTRTAPDKRTVFCIFLALFGVWLLATGGKPGNMELTPRGLFWGLMAGIGAASYSLLSRAPVKHRGSIAVMDRPFPCGVLETSQYGIQLSEDYIIAPIAAFCACLFFTPHFVLRPVLSQLSMQFTSVKFLGFKNILCEKRKLLRTDIFFRTQQYNIFL